MVKRLAAIGCAAALFAVSATRNQTAAAQATPPAPPAAPSAPGAQGAAAPRALLDRYCAGCHSQNAKAAGQEPARKLTVDDLDVAHIAEHAEVWERIVR